MDKREKVYLTFSLFGIFIILLIATFVFISFKLTDSSLEDIEGNFYEDEFSDSSLGIFNLNKRLVNLSEDYVRESPEERSKISEELIEISQKRYDLLYDFIRENPKEAQEYFFTFELDDTFPEEVKQLTEKEVELEGTIKVVYPSEKKDDLFNSLGQIMIGCDSTVAYLIVNDSVRYKICPHSPCYLIPEGRVRVKGIKVKDTIFLGLNSEVDYILESDYILKDLINNEAEISIIKTQERSGPIMVNSIEDLYNIRDDLTAYYLLNRDLDFCDQNSYSTPLSFPGISDFCKAQGASVGWVPIGNSSYNVLFIGIFDGNNKKIINLYINRSSGNYIGLFGYASNSEIKNLILKNVEIRGNIYVAGLIGLGENNTILNSNTEGIINVTGHSSGGLIGYNGNSFINNSYSNVNISSSSNYVGGLVGRNAGNSTINNSYSTGEVFGDAFVGGLAGKNYDSSTITNCYSYSDVYGGTNVGGLVGLNNNYATIENSHSSGTVSVHISDTCGCSTPQGGGLVGLNEINSNINNCFSTSNVMGITRSGGLVGQNSQNSKISNSYSTGNTNITSQYAGGLVGYNTNSVINNSYSTGNAIGRSQIGGLVGNGAGPSSIIINSFSIGNASIYSGGNFISKVGGLVGEANSGLKIINCYSIGTATGNTSVGGLIGLRDNAEINNSYWNIETSTLNESDGGEGKTTSEMKSFSTFFNSGWNISKIEYWENEIWIINDTNYYPRLWWSESEIESTTPPSSNGGGGPGGSPSGGIIQYTKDFSISAEKIELKLRQNQTKTREITIKNEGDVDLEISLEITVEISGILSLSKSNLNLNSGESEIIFLNFVNEPELSPTFYIGELIVSSEGIEKKVNISIETFIFDLNFIVHRGNQKFIPGKEMVLDINITNIELEPKIKDIWVHYKIFDSENNQVFNQSEIIELMEIKEYSKNINVPSNLTKGEYMLYVEVEYGEEVLRKSFWFEVRSSFWETFFTIISYFIILVLLGLIAFLIHILIKRHKEKY